jgi:sialidase-1
MLISEKPGSECTYNFNGRGIGICVTSGPDAGVIEYSVDGKPFRKVDQFTKWSRSLHLPWYIMLDDQLKSGNHTLKLKISEEKNERSSGNACRIEYFLVNE